MNPPERPIEEILRDLQERAKELDCLYKIEELLKDPKAPRDEILRGVIQAIPMGLQYPGICVARIFYRNETYQPEGFAVTPWSQKAPIQIQGETIGSIEVYYTQQAPKADEGPFLKEERRLINSIAERLGLFFVHRDLDQALVRLQTARESLAADQRGQWAIILEFLKRTDQSLLMRITRKMANHLAWSGVDEAIALLRRGNTGRDTEEAASGEENRPLERLGVEDFLAITDETFLIAEKNLSDDEIVSCIQMWMNQDKARFLVNAVEGHDTSLSEVRAALGRYRQLGPETIHLPPSVQKGVLVSLINRFLTDQIEYINVAKRFLCIEDFIDLLDRVVAPRTSQGKLGGKSAGLFLAMTVLRSVKNSNEQLGQVRCPKTWYISSDGLLDFIRFNNLEDVYDQKYVETTQVRQEYPHIVQVFKSSRFSTEIMDGLSVALDDLEGSPLIVRSSSLLEDRFGAAFSGKYKSLFLANQGTKQERLEALLDAITEVYASTFGPDPIEYRAERGLTDVYEEMGIMIQEVVGTRVGPYFLPAFSGVAFSHNEFRWSSRIKRDDGLVRVVPGLGTRAVDRLKDDYPLLLAPGQPGLRVNVTPDEVVRYSPRKIDVVNLVTGGFETIDIEDLLRDHGAEYPQVRQLVSAFDGDHLRTPMGLLPDFSKGNLIITFDGLIKNTPFIATMRCMLKLLEDALGSPVDIEFASNGKDFYLLQCRPQSHVGDSTPSAIPHDIPPERTIFSANRYVSNGKVPDITHIVYVDPARYSELSDLEEMKGVGRAVGRLNNLLPKRQFVLIGPGRWGSRGDIRLGVNVTYSDINNTAVLIEVARKKGSYVPDLSFGTHFFQDLVESSIRYLPLYPDDEGITFREEFLRSSATILAEILPEYAHLSDTIRVIDVPAVTGGMVMRVLMNGDQDEAVGVLVSPQVSQGDIIEEAPRDEYRPEHHWRWRLRFAERIAAELDPERFGVQAFYLLGSTKNATAGPGSDIDLIIHFRGSPVQLGDLKSWLEGWSLCLSEVNFLRTGYQSAGLLDVHIITDEDIANKTSYAAKIGAITDPARLLPLRGRSVGKEDS
jgi:pyruvate, water dikinase